MVEAENEEATAALDIAIAQAERAEPWKPISEPYELGDELDILLSDGSILCAVLPQFDGDLWWGGDGTGEKFIDPKTANVTHWRIHGSAPVAITEDDLRMLLPDPFMEADVSASLLGRDVAVNLHTEDKVLDYGLAIARRCGGMK